jgi:hypothetical protein
MIGRLLELLRTLPVDKLCCGFGEPHAYYGYHNQVSFQFAYNKTVAQLIEHVLEALDHVFEGWKAGDKVRTYRFQDDKVFNHETNKATQCSKVLRGHFDLFWKE